MSSRAWVEGRRATPAGRTYGSTDLIALTGCTYRQLDYWVRTGRIFPTPATAAPGSGASRDYPAHEVDVIAVTLELLGAGFDLDYSIEYARKILAGEEIVLAAGLVTIAMP